MKAAITAATAIAIALSATPQAHAGGFGDWAKGAVRDVADFIVPPPPPPPKPVVAPLPRPNPVTLPALDVRPPERVVADEIVDLSDGLIDGVEDIAGDAKDAGEKAVKATADAVYMVATDPKAALKAVADTASDAWEGIKTTADFVFTPSDERDAMVEAAYEAVKPLLPLLNGFADGMQDAEVTKEIVQKIKDGDVEGAARLLPRLGKYRELINAADAYGFETITVGFGGDGSMIVGGVGEMGIAVSVAEAKADTPEEGAEIYVSYGLTFGASAGGDGTLGVGLWRAPVRGIVGDSWGVVGAAAAGPMGGSAGVWFAPDTEGFAGMGDLGGVTAGGSVGFGVEVGELNYVRTRLFDAI